MLQKSFYIFLQLLTIKTAKAVLRKMYKAANLSFTLFLPFFEHFTTHFIQVFAYFTISFNVKTKIDNSKAQGKNEHKCNKLLFFFRNVKYILCFYICKLHFYM